MVKETSQHYARWKYTSKFQSPLGEVVKETKDEKCGNELAYMVSIPSRGSGKGDLFLFCLCSFSGLSVSIPSRGSGKGDCDKIAKRKSARVSIPSRGSGKGDR